jgi:transcriptional regulator with XRE-family HTH domain
MKLNQMSASAFAEEIGVQRSSVSHVLSGRNKPSLEFIQKVLRTFPKVDANWLVNGSTEVDKDQFDLKVKGETEIRTKAENPKVESSNDNNSEVTNTDNTAQKTIKKVLVFYTDGTFEELTKP